MANCEGAFLMTDKNHLNNIVNSLQDNQGLLFELNPFEDGKDVDLNIFTAEYSFGMLTKLLRVDIEGRKKGYSKDVNCTTDSLTDKQFEFINLHRTKQKFHFGFEYKIDFQQLLGMDPQNNHFYVVGAPFKNRDGMEYFSLWLMLPISYEQESLISIEEIAGNIDVNDEQQKAALKSQGILYLKPCPPHWETQ